MERLSTLLALTLLAGCNSGPGSSMHFTADDAGHSTAHDAGTSTHHDGGSSTAQDAGHSTAHDAGTTSHPDAGSGPVTCGTDIVPAPTGPACAASTLSCLEACGDETCADGCFAADPAGAACQGCSNDAWVSCANANGCQAQWDELMCCYDSCPDPESAACDTACSAEGAAYDSCSAGVVACDDSDYVCFAGGAGEPPSSGF